MGANYKYLGKKVKDWGIKGLDSAREFYGIIRAIKQDLRKGVIDRKTARGRLLLLYRLSFKKNNSKIKHLSDRTLQNIRKRIKEEMRKL